MADNDSNQPSNSNDNYQQMPDEPPAAAIIVAVPDLSPPPAPDGRVAPPIQDVPPSGPPVAPGPPVHEPRVRLESSGLSDLGLATTQTETGEDPMQPIAPPLTPPGQQNPPYQGTLTDPTLGTPAPTTVAPPPEVAPWHRPSGAPMDEGFYTWLSHHGVTPGDPAQAYRMEEFKSNYLSLPQADHDSYIAVGRADPENHRFNLTPWSTLPGMPPPNPGSTMEHLPPLLPPDEDPGAPMPEPGPQPTPTPMPIVGSGQGGPDASGLSDLGLPSANTVEQDRRAMRSDWEPRPYVRRTWNSRLGRYV